jgi:hypothetical protein
MAGNSLRMAGARSASVRATAAMEVVTVITAAVTIAKAGVAPAPKCSAAPIPGPLIGARDIVIHLRAFPVLMAIYQSTG